MISRSAIALATLLFMASSGFAELSDPSFEPAGLVEQHGSPVQSQLTDMKDACGAAACGDACGACATACGAPCAIVACLQAHHLFPCMWCAPGNMVPHTPYEAWPKTYYYFRPYNYMHVQQQQEQAIQWGADPGLPYSNAVFQQVYHTFEEESLPAPEEIGSP